MSKYMKKEIVIAIINYLIFCFAIAVVMFAMKYSRQTATNRYVEDITKDWKNYYGESIDLDRICHEIEDEKDNKKKDKNDKENEDKRFYASYDLIRKVNRNYTLVFRASSCFVNVYVDGKLVSTDDSKQNYIFGKSPGHRWHMISINSDEKKCDISLEVESAYNDGKGGIDNVYVGAPLGIVKQVLRDRISGFIISVVLVILGMILCTLYCLVRKKQRRKDDAIIVSKIILYTGLLTILMGIYSSVETYFWQFFIGRSHFFQLVSYIATFMIAVVIGIMGRELIKNRRKNLGVVIYWTGMILFIGSTICNFSGVLDYYYTMKIAYIYCALLSILIFVEGYNYIKKQDSISKALLFGVCFFSVTFACDSLRYLSGIQDDICAYTRVGFLVFIICILIETSEKAIKTMQQGVLADLYKRMADTDTLTGLNNRNALLFDECKYNEYIRNNQKLAVVMFDVNDLKYVNDNFGHDKGDMLIKTAAKLINNNFGKLGKCYRTGGDEFISVLNCESVEENYKNALKAFLDEIKEHNTNNKSTDLEIAYGVYMSDDESVGVMWQKADELMYKKKKEMKDDKKVDRRKKVKQR